MGKKIYNKDLDALSLSIIGGFVSGVFILSGSKIQEILTLNGYKNLGDILFVSIILLPFIYFVRKYIKKK